MVTIDTNIIGAVLAFVAGVGIASLNYALSRYILKNAPKQYTSTQIIKQLVQIAYIVLIYFFADKTPWNPLWVLVGGCLGITVPMLWFTFKLVKLNDSLKEKEESSNG